MQIKNKKVFLISLLFIIIAIMLYVFNDINTTVLISKGAHIKNINYANCKKIFSCCDLEWFEYINIDEVYYVQNKDYYMVLKYTIPKSNENEYDKVVAKDWWYVEKIEEDHILIDTWDFSANEYIEQYQNKIYKNLNDPHRHILHKFKNQNEIVYYLYSEIYSLELDKIIKKLL